MKGATGIDFRILGPIEAWQDGRRLVLGERRQRLLLGLLLLDVGKPVALERLIELAWMDQDPPRTARNAVQVAISRLRRIFGESAPIIGGDGYYELSADPESVDLHRFHWLLRDAKFAAPANRKALLDQALALWRGPILVGTFSPDVRQILCSAAEEARLQAIEDSAAARLDLGEEADLLSKLTRLVTENPLRERLVGYLMTALYRSGRQAESLETYLGTRKRLIEDLGIEPGPELQSLYQRILRADPDLLRRSRVTTAASTFLPRDIPDFAGRVTELAWLDDAAQVRSAIAVISAVTGLAGVGKTALATRWAYTALSQFPDGQLYLNLRGYDSEPPLTPMQALAHLLGCLGVTPDRMPTDAAQAQAQYRSVMGGKRMLILLDDARDAEQVRPLLPGEPDCLVLVTSREQLSGLIARDGARRLTLGLLPDADALELVTQMVGPQRVTREPEGFSELLRICAGHPLALRIAAAHLCDSPHEQVATYVAQLRDRGRLDTLTIPGDKQAGLHQVLGHSAQALSPMQRQVFGLLSVSPGPTFTADSVSALAALPAEQAQRALGALAGLHLIFEVEPGRYGWHELTWEFARRVQDQEPDQAAIGINRILGYYRDRTQAAYQVIRPGWATGKAEPGETPEDAVAWFTAEQPNLVAAISLAGRRGQAETLTSILEPLWQVCHSQRRISAWIATFEPLLAAMPVETPTQRNARVHVLHTLGNAYVNAGQFDQAITAHQRCIELWTGQADWVGVARARTNLATSYERQARYTEALTELEIAREMAQSEGQETLVAYILTAGLANVCRRLGRLDEARNHLNSALVTVRASGSSLDTARALNGLANVYLEMAQPQQSLALLDEALNLADQVNNPAMRTVIASTMAQAYGELGRYAEAIELMHTVQQDFQRLGHHGMEASVLMELGRLYARAGQTDDASRSFGQAMIIAQQAGEQHTEGRALLGLSETLPDPVVRQKHLRAAVSILEHISAPEAATARRRLTM
jgi:DNA-binding SARP family transcriptional activator/tetratricopeptide (TPR) repeat protein